MNTDSVDLVLFATGDEAAAHGPGGAVWADDHSCLYIVFPGVPGRHLDAITVSRDHDAAVKTSRTWYWNGNVEKPTLTPSLLFTGCWHGYLTAGRLKSC